MTVWAVIPVKAPEACKTRLAPILPPQARQALVRRMLAHVADIAAQDPAIDEVLLAGPSRHGLAPGLRLLPDPGGGLNAVATAVLRAAHVEGITRLILLSADLPSLIPADLAALTAAAGLAIAPDEAGQGTNALSLPLPAAASFTFHYGPGSRHLHEAEALRLNLVPQIIMRPTLAFDLDEPAGLEKLSKQAVLF